MSTRHVVARVVTPRDEARHVVTFVSRRAATRLVTTCRHRSGQVAICRGDYSKCSRWKFKHSHIRNSISTTLRDASPHLTRRRDTSRPVTTCHDLSRDKGKSNAVLEVHDRPQRNQNLKLHTPTVAPPCTRGLHRYRNQQCSRTCRSTGTDTYEVGCHPLLFFT